MAHLSSGEVQTSDFIFFDGSNRLKKFMSKSQLSSSAEISDKPNCK